MHEVLEYDRVTALTLFLLWIFPRIPYSSESQVPRDCSSGVCPHPSQLAGRDEPESVGFCRSLHQPLWTFCLSVSGDRGWHGYSVVETCLDPCDFYHPNRILYPEHGRLPGEHGIILRCFWCVPQTTEVRIGPGVMTRLLAQEEPQNGILPTHTSLPHRKQMQSCWKPGGREQFARKSLIDLWPYSCPFL